MQPPCVPLLCFIDLDVSYLVQLVIVGVFLLVIHRLLIRPIITVLDDRRQRTVGNHERASALKARADQDITRYEDAIFAAKNKRAEVLARHEAESLPLIREHSEAARREFEKRLEADLARLEGHHGQAMREVNATAHALGNAIVTQLVEEEKDR